MKYTLKQIIIILIFLIIYLFISYDKSFSGAWPLEKGNIYERFSFNYYSSNKEFNNKGNEVSFSNNGSFSDYYINNYLEYGLYDNLTIINSFYIKRMRKNDSMNEQKTFGIGDIDIGAKLKITELAGGIISTQLLTKLPLAYNKHDDLPLGNGQVDIELRLLYGHSLYPLIPGYFNLEFGYRWRFEEPSNEIRYLLEFGIDATKDIYSRVKFDGIYNVNRDINIDHSGNPTAKNNYDLGRIEFVIGYKCNKKWSIEAGMTPSIYGRNIAKGNTYTLAIIFIFKGSDLHF